MNGDAFGPLTGLVGTVGSIFAAGIAIALTWRGRARWEPSETDIAKGPERVGGLVTAVLIVILFVVTRPQGSVGLLPVLAIFLLLVCVASLLAYSYITGTNTYDDAKRDRKIIGGFKLTPRAKREMRAQKLTEQRFFGTVEYDPDEVWPRSSRSLAKLVFVALYLLLVVSGTVAIAAAAILIEKQGTAPAPTESPEPSSTALPAPSPSSSASASITPTSTPSPTAIVDERTLKWVETGDPTMAAIDGGVFEVGKSVWLAELFPDSPPSRFKVLERIDPSLPVELRNALRNFSFPEFEPVVNGYRAISDSAWKLPTPIEGIGYRTFYFVDENPEGEEVRSGTITSGTLKITVASSDAGCKQVGEDGIIVGEVGAAGTCIALSLAAARDPTFDATLLVPWGNGDTDLIAAVRSSMDEVSERLGNANPPVAFNSGQAMGSFLERNDAFLPNSQPNDWGLDLVEDSMVVAPDLPQVLHVDLDLGSSASAMVAVRLVDRATGEVFLSPLLPIATTGNGRPTITIETPASDITGGASVPYDDYGSGSKSYGYVNVEARADDPEDGRLSEGSIVWTTDRTDLQDALIGEGEEPRLQLWAPTCEDGAVHTITATARDSNGGEATAQRVIEVGIGSGQSCGVTLGHATLRRVSDGDQHRKRVSMPQMNNAAGVASRRGRLRRPNQ